MADSRFTSTTIDRSKPLSFLILGSGGSAAVPVISCVTDLANVCACCKDTIASGSGEHSKNKRGNTGGVLRIPQIGGGEATILVDCGKTFREQALRYFPDKGLRRIDACILTHHHADATDGLDDLRAWTNKAIIEKTIPVYCSQTTYDFISASFPYMMSKKASSGGGSVPSFQWHILPEDQDWEICGVTITPLPVHHGVYFDKIPREPLICLGFLFDSSLLYMSDVSFISEEIWTRLSRKLSLPSPTGSYDNKDLPRLQGLVIDVSGLRAGPSHFGLPQAIEASRRLGARKSYFTDISHRHSHESYLAFSLAFEKHAYSTEAKKQGLDQHDPPPLWKVRRPEGGNEQPPFEHVYEGIDFRVEDLELYTERALEAVEGWAGGVGPGSWTRPARDGMTICWQRSDSSSDW
ncbi:MBL fold metallo-hydrolase [Sporobolomyces salmoneus]|uniref:MBL fold metallo-hydrolase n=1 Tax=Sporobolomyces salmoneus TaxID=183962 RepID=UPI00317103A9